MATTLRAPSGLATRGRRLWRELTALHDFDPAERVLLEEACRMADRLDRLDALLTGSEDAWLKLRTDDDGTEVRVVIDSALSEARQQANVLKQLVTALRVPDAQSGQRPGRRPPRGAYKTGAAAAQPPAKVTSLRDRLRQSG